MRSQLASEAESVHAFVKLNHPYGLQLLRLRRAGAIAGGDWDAALDADKLLTHVSNSYAYARSKSDNFEA